jgi:hypothetical protein
MKPRQASEEGVLPMRLTLSSAGNDDMSMFCCRRRQDQQWQLNIVKKAMHSDGIAAAAQGCEEVVGDRRRG